MSKNNYSEVEPTDDEIQEELEQIYPEEINVCGMKMNPVYVLKRMDRVAFDMYASDNMRWYKCDDCGTVYKSDDAEDEAIECCQNHCSSCGKDIDGDPDYYELCEDCAKEIDSESK